MNPSKQDAAIAQALADVATIGILQERSVRRAVALAGQLQHALDSRVMVEQAKGVLAATLRVDMGVAFATMRGYARSNNLALYDVADDIVNRTLDLSDYAAGQ